MNINSDLYLFKARMKSLALGEFEINIIAPNIEQALKIALEHVEQHKPYRTFISINAGGEEIFMESHP